MRILKLDKQKFIDWYFSDDIIESFVSDNDVRGSLLSDGEFKMTLQGLLDSVGYLPVWVVSEDEVVAIQPNGDIDTEFYDEIKFA
jgi:hypothetical protein